MQILNLSATLNVASLEPSINTYRLGEGAGTYEYPELNNKPQINGVTLVGDISSANLGIKTSDLTNNSGFISEADIPTATSDLVNDSGFVNSTQVQSVVAGAIPSDISYFNNDVGYITNADIGNIPTRTSQLINDSGYITAAEAPVTSVNGQSGAVDLDGTNIEYEQNVSLNSKIDAVENSIPTATSQLENDSGYITNANIPTRTSQLVNDSGFVNSQNIPVQSVNNQTGAVELTATDIPYDGGTETVWDILNPTAYSTTGLTYSGVTLQDGGYIKIGKFVIVNVRIKANSSLPLGTGVISGLPTPIVSNNTITASNNVNTSIIITTSGEMIVQKTLSTNEVVMANVVYICS